MLLVFLLLLSSSALLERRAREAAALRANIARYDSLLAPLLAREIKTRRFSQGLGSTRKPDRAGSAGGAVAPGAGSEDERVGSREERG